MFGPQDPVQNSSTIFDMALLAFLCPHGSHKNSSFNHRCRANDWSDSPLSVPWSRDLKKLSYPISSPVLFYNIMVQKIVPACLVIFHGYESHSPSFPSHVSWWLQLDLSRSWSLFPVPRGWWPQSRCPAADHCVHRVQGHKMLHRTALLMVIPVIPAMSR